MMRERNSPSRPRAAFLTQEFPWPLDNGLKHRSFQILSSLANEFDTTLICFSQTGIDPRHAETIRAIIPGISKIVTEKHLVRLRGHAFRISGVMVRSILMRQPFSMVKFLNRRMHRRVRQLAADIPIEFAVTTLPMTRYAFQLVGAERVVYECQNIEFALWESLNTDAPFWKRPSISNEVRRLKAVEEQIWRQSGMVITLCNEDSDVVRAASAGANVVVIPPVIPSASSVPSSPGLVSANPLDRRWERWNGGTVGLLGNWKWLPSRSGLDWFLREVMPKLQRHANTPKVVLAGVGLTAADCKKAEQLGIEVLGYLEDIEQFYDQVDIVVGPYFCGGGVRVKILEALMHRKLVIGTPLAFRGLPFQPGKNAILCQSADQFVERIREFSGDEKRS